MKNNWGDWIGSIFGGMIGLAFFGGIALLAGISASAASNYGEAWQVVVAGAIAVLFTLLTIVFLIFAVLQISEHIGRTHESSTQGREAKGEGADTFRSEGMSVSNSARSDNASDAPFDQSTNGRPVSVAVTHASAGKSLTKERAAHEAKVNSVVTDRSVIVLGAVGLTAFSFVLLGPCFGVVSLIIFAGLAAWAWGLADRLALSKASKIFCPHCGKFLPSDLAWVCGRCGTEHHKDNRHSYLTECKECGIAPTAYQCHHPDCAEIIYLDGTYDSSFCAYGVGRPEPSMNERRKRQERIAEMEDENKMLNLHLDSAKKLNELSDSLEQAKKRRETPQKRIPKTPREKIEENWRRHHQTLYDLRSYVAALKTEAKKLHDDNPEELEKAEEDIESFYNEQLRLFESGEL